MGRVILRGSAVIALVSFLSCGIVNENQAFVSERTSREWMGAARALYEQHEYERAVAACRGLALGFPDSGHADDATLLLGLATLRLADERRDPGLLAEARGILQQGLRLYGGRPPAREMRYRLGHLLSGRGRKAYAAPFPVDCAGALPLVQGVVDSPLSPAWMKAGALLDRAECLLLAGSTNEGLQTLDRVVRDYGGLLDPEADAPGTTFALEARSVGRARSPIPEPGGDEDRGEKSP